MNTKEKEENIYVRYKRDAAENIIERTKNPQQHVNDYVTQIYIHMYMYLINCEHICVYIVIISFLPRSLLRSSSFITSHELKPFRSCI